MPDLLLHQGLPEFFPGDTGGQSALFVVSVVALSRGMVPSLDSTDRPTYRSGLTIGARVLCNGFQFPHRISRQLKRTVGRSRLRTWCAMPCCYCTEAVVEHGGRSAQSLTFITRQAASIDVELTGERGFRHIATGHFNQLSLRCRKSINQHLLSCYKYTLCYSSTNRLRPTLIMQSTNILMSMEPAVTKTLPNSVAKVERTLSRP